MHVHILYELKAREFQPLALLKYELEKRGHKISFQHLLDKPRVSLLVKKPDVILVTNLNSDEAINSFVYNIVGKGVPVFNLQWEQLFAKQHDKNLLLKDDRFIKMSYQLCWGPKRQKFLEELNVCDANIFVCGSLNFDFLKPRFSHFLLDKEYLRKKFNLPNLKCNLFVSSFTYFLEEITPEIEQDFEKQTGGSKLKPFAEVSTFSFNEISEWMIKYLEIYENEIIIYRPHPAEMSKKHLLRLNHKRLYIIQDLPLCHWINYADECFTWYSTSIFEMTMLNKPIKILRPFEIPDEYEIDFYERLDKITNFHDFAYKNAHLMNIEFLEEYYYIDNYSYEKIVDAIERIGKLEKKKDYFKGYKYKFNLVAFFAKYMIHCFPQDFFVYNIIKLLNRSWYSFIMLLYDTHNKNIITIEEINIFQNMLKSVLDK